METATPPTESDRSNRQTERIRSVPWRFLAFPAFVSEGAAYMRLMAGDPLEEIPHEKREALREALAALVREGVALTVRVLRERAGAKTEHAGVVLAAYRSGKFALERAPRPPAVVAPPPAAPVAPVAPLLVGPRDTAPPAPALPPPGAPAPTAEQLASLVACVDSHEKSLDATREVMRAVAMGMTCPHCEAAYSIDQKAARLLIDGLGEARQAIKGAALEGDGEVDTLLPATSEAVDLVRLFEAITSDERRAAVLSYAQHELAADEASGPRALGQASTGGTG